MNPRQQNFYCQALQTLYSTVHRPETAVMKDKKEMFQCVLGELTHHLKQMYRLTMEQADAVVEVVSKSDTPFSGPRREKIKIEEISKRKNCQIDFVRRYYPGETWCHYGSGNYHQERATVLMQILGGWENNYSVLGCIVPEWWKGMENIEIVQCAFTSNIRFLINGTVGLTVPPMDNFTKSALGV
jgi:hypothetical protein